MDEQEKLALLALINKIIYFEKRRIVSDTETTLHPSEIHMLLVLVRHPGNATILAEKLGITKGAVSQTLSRLVRKDIIVKRKDTSSKNELEITLTRKGRALLKDIEKKELSIIRGIDTYMSMLTQDERAVIDRFIVEMNKVFDFKA